MPSRFGSPVIVQPSNAVETYQKYLTLREMMDRRKHNEVLNRSQEALAKQRERDEVEYQQFQQNLPNLPKDASLEDTVKLLGYKYGLPIAKQIQENKEAQGKAQKEELEALAKRDLLLANKAEGYLWLKPEERQRSYETDTPDFLKLGLITEDQAKAPLGDDNAIESWVAKGKGREYLIGLKDKLAKRTEDAAEAARKEEKEQIELAGHYFGGVKDQPSYDMWRRTLPTKMRAEMPQEFTPENMKVAGNMLLTAQQRAQQQEQSKPPAEEQTFRSLYYPGWLASKGVPDTPQNALQAFREFIADRRERVGGVPGVDVPFAPGVAQQKIDMAAAGAENKPMSAEASKLKSIAETLVPELDALETAIRNGGRGAIAGIVSGSNAELRRLAESAADKVGRLRSGGAINKDEESRFMGQIARLADMLNKGGPDAAASAIGRYRAEAKTVLGGIAPNRKPPGAGPDIPNPITDNKQATHRFNPATGKVEPIKR